jgi:hypothetical protein
MAAALKVLASEITLSNTTPNTVNGASLVRLVNTNASISSVLTLFYANGSVKATTTLGHYGTDFARIDLVKQPDETIQSSLAPVIKAASIAYL